MKKEMDKYWEKEKGEIIKFGNKFMRCFNKSGKLQFGTVYKSKETNEEKYIVKFVLDKKELINSDEGADYLVQTIKDWKNEN